jgi:hypothetical protein
MDYTRSSSTSIADSAPSSCYVGASVLDSRLSLGAGLQANPKDGVRLSLTSMGCISSTSREQTTMRGYEGGSRRRRTSCFCERLEVRESWVVAAF